MMFWRYTGVFFSVALFAATTAAGFSQPAIPQFTDKQSNLAQPDLSDLPRLRFLTTTDFFPFNFLDSRDNLTGFHVDLARSVCQELELSERCQIQALAFEELREALESGDGEAIIAGLAITEDSRKDLIFTRSYLQFPARFLAHKDAETTAPLHQNLIGKRVGVLDETVHEAMLRDLFPGVQVVTYSRQEWLLGDLKKGEIYAAFGDGMRFAFWLAGNESEGCCMFSGGPYLAPEYLGHGLAIAVRPDRADLAAALDYALQRVETNGTFTELYLRYFPVSFY